MSEVKSSDTAVSIDVNYVDAFNAGTVEKRGFGVRDRKGREIGGSVHLYTLVLVEVPQDDKPRGLWRFAPGTYYVFEPHATRDGQWYGALQGGRFFTTEASRAAAVEKYFAQAAKRASKIAKVEG